MSSEAISFLISLPDEDDQDVKGIFSADAEVAMQDIPVDKLKENITKMCTGLTTALSDIKKIGDFKLKEVTVGVEISAQGGVHFIGTVNVEGKSTITLTFVEE